MSFVHVKACRCDKCGHVWIPKGSGGVTRQASLPKKCARCDQSGWMWAGRKPVARKPWVKATIRREKKVVPKKRGPRYVWPQEALLAPKN